MSYRSCGNERPEGQQQLIQNRWSPGITGTRTTWRIQGRCTGGKQCRCNAGHQNLRSAVQQ